MIYAVVSVAILMTMVLAVARAVRGPSIYDRVLAANMFGTKTALLLAVVSFLFERADFLDLALAYALINLVGVLAVLEFVESKPASEPLDPESFDASHITHKRKEQSTKAENTTKITVNCSMDNMESDRLGDAQVDDMTEHIKEEWMMTLLLTRTHYGKR